MQISPANSPPPPIAQHSKRNGRYWGRGNQPTTGSPMSAVWREQKRQANAIIQVAAVISCLISIINTRHRHGRRVHPSPIPCPIPPPSISNNGHKSFHMPSVWSAQSMVHSGQGISTGNAIFYFRADFDSFPPLPLPLLSRFFGYASQPELSPFFFPFVLSTVSDDEFNNLRRQKAQKK